MKTDTLGDLQSHHIMINKSITSDQGLIIHSNSKLDNVLNGENASKKTIGGATLSVIK